MAKIPAEIVRLDDPGGFDERFYELISKYPTQQQAYEATEAEYFEWFGKNRWGDFNSYRSGRNQRFKKRK